jgi:hypothetical protein
MTQRHFDMHSAAGTVQVTKLDTVDGPSAAWEALFPGGKREKFYGERKDVREAVQQMIWRIL